MDSPPTVKVSRRHQRPRAALLHPNAYTPRTFRQFLEPLTADYHVLAARQRPLWYLSPGYDQQDRPETFIEWDWDGVADDLLQFLDEQGLDTVIGVGHSLGAIATMIAARKQPERFPAIVLIEPVFLPPPILERLAENPQLSEERPIVHSAKRRSNRWSSRQAAFDRFRAKPVFGRWSDDALWDYVNEGLHEDPTTGEVILSYPREWEARFYARPPINVWDELPGLSVPTLGSALRKPIRCSLMPGHCGSPFSRKPPLWRWRAWAIC
ncbi:MAG: alpha/beta hydrolase [Chloroflexota bacterium]